MCDSSRGPVPKNIWKEIPGMSIDDIIKKYGNDVSDKQFEHIKTYKRCISRSADVQVKGGTSLKKQSGTKKKGCTKKWLGTCPTSAQQCSQYKKDSTIKKNCLDAFCKHKTKNEPYIKRGSKRKACNKKMSYTSEPIPDYIMRALKPKKSVHPEYGKLRY